MDNGIINYNNDNIEIFNDDEIVTFLDEDESIEYNTSKDFWKIMIVDDDESVHNITKIVLDNFVLDRKLINFISAYSGAEAKKLIKENPDTAIILLDVVMESDIAGLEFVKYIREELKNLMTRIILRTGQPGQAPDKKVIIDYDINDYKLKTELTEDKLFITVIAALRSFKELTILNNTRIGLEKIIKVTTRYITMKDFSNFLSSILNQLATTLNLNGRDFKNKPSGIIATKQEDNFIVVDFIGNYIDSIGKVIDDVLSESELSYIKTAIMEKKQIETKKQYVNYFEQQNGTANIIYLNNIEDLDEWDRNLMNIFFTNIIMAIDNLLLSNEMESTQSEIIYTLGEVAEWRSKESSYHCKRVAEYSKILALKYGMDEEIAERIRMISPMHDIGKIGIPDSILNKPGKLTHDEFEIMKTHTKIGYEMLKNSKMDTMKMGSIIALQHHEKYNGTGYPYGLKGENIHIYGRLTALADVFDALCSARAYKEPWNLDTILKFFAQERGKHFDPKLVDIFFENLDDFIKIKNKFTDDVLINI